ncbi:MAG: hypothetical protein WC897_04165 [Candidatus Gracilibacteria bacterium]
MRLPKEPDRTELRKRRLLNDYKPFVDSLARCPEWGDDPMDVLPISQWGEEWTVPILRFHHFFQHILIDWDGVTSNDVFILNRDLFSDLGISYTNSQADISLLYRAFIANTHPDRHLTLNDDERARIVAMRNKDWEAWRLIVQPLLRERYVAADIRRWKKYKQYQSYEASLCDMETSQSAGQNDVSDMGRYPLARLLDVDQVKVSSPSSVVGQCISWVKGAVLPKLTEELVEPYAPISPAPILPIPVQSAPIPPAPIPMASIPSAPIPSAPIPPVQKRVVVGPVVDIALEQRKRSVEQKEGADLCEPFPRSSRIGRLISHGLVSIGFFVTAGALVYWLSSDKKFSNLGTTTNPITVVPIPPNVLTHPSSDNGVEFVPPFVSNKDQNEIEVFNGKIEEERDDISRQFFAFCDAFDASYKGLKHEIGKNDVTKVGVDMEFRISVDDSPEPYVVKISSTPNKKTVEEFATAQKIDLKTAVVYLGYKEINSSIQKRLAKEKNSILEYLKNNSKQKEQIVENKQPPKKTNEKPADAQGVLSVEVIRGNETEIVIPEVSAQTQDIVSPVYRTTGWELAPRSGDQNSCPKGWLDAWTNDGAVAVLFTVCDDWKVESTCTFSIAGAKKPMPTSIPSNKIVIKPYGVVVDDLKTVCENAKSSGSSIYRLEINRK